MVKSAAAYAPNSKLLKRADDKQGSQEPQDADACDLVVQPQDADARPNSSRRGGIASQKHTSSQNVSIIKYIVDSIDSIVDQICQRVLSIPLQIRYFAKAIYDNQKADKACSDKQAFVAVQQYLLEKWLTQVAFKDMVVHGLTKTYYVKQNALSNLQLMGIGLNKIFSLDESPYEDDFLQPLNALFTKKQEKIYGFYKELIDVPDLDDLDKLFQADADGVEDSFSSACLCLTLNDVRFLYDFMLNFRELFESSKQSANILMEDLDHFIKSNKIFQNKKM